MPKAKRGARSAPGLKEHTFQSAVPKIRLGRQTESLAWSGAYRQLLNTMAQTLQRRGKVRVSRDRIFHQRVAVRIRYAKNRVSGQWKAHGRYLDRESAGEGGFNAQGVSKPSEELKAWQEVGDERIWKVIVSPENDLDLEEYTRELMARVSKDLGQPLIWTAAVHTNTAHKHAHIVVRGIDGNGQAVKFSPEYVKETFRARAQALATERLGHRFESDIVYAQQQMIGQSRYTDLDRKIIQRAKDGRVFVNPQDHEITGLRLGTERQLAQRLTALAGMGLASRVDQFDWNISDDLENRLRTSQRVHDRQRTIDRFGVLASDPRIPFQSTNWRDIQTIEGRVLVHGQEDQADRAYLLLEDVNGKVHYLEHRPEIEAARQKGLLQPGSYAAMRVTFVDRKAYWIVEDHGDAAVLQHSPEFIDRCLKRGVNPPEHGFGGWLGNFRSEIQKARAVQVVESPPRTEALEQAHAHKQPDRPTISPDQARQEFEDALFDAGLVVSHPIADGQLHRVAVEGGKRGNKSGAYVLHLDDQPAGYIHNYKTGVEINWKASGATRPLSAEQIRESRVAARVARAEQEAARAKEQEAVAVRSTERWSQAAPAGEHAYLAAKGISAGIARVDHRGNLLVPMQDVNGKTWGVQSILPDGQKLFPKGVRKMGSHAVLGKVDPSKKLVITEGYATAVSVRQIHGGTVVAAFDSGNLLPVAEAYRAKYPNLQIVFAADNDHHLPLQLDGTGKPMRNVGIAKAQEAAKAVGGSVIYPEFSAGQKATDWNDYVALHGVVAAKAHFVDALGKAKRHQRPIGHRKGRKPS